MSPTIVFILGPTASGKSQLALDLAQELNADIINADTIQVYDKLDIGSAKPTLEEQQIITHHLISHVPVGGIYTAGTFRKEVFEVLEKQIKAGKNLFFIVGGSGFYLKALLYGLYEIPTVPKKIQDEVISTPIEKLYEELRSKDPQAAESISPQDSYRVARAVEVIRATGRKFSSFKEDFEKRQVSFPWSYKKIGLNTDKPKLKIRVEARAKKMLEDGLLQETKSLMDLGHGEWAPLNSVGYKEAKMFLNGEISQDELLALITQSTMQLIKKQMTWFKKDSEIEWFDISEGFDKPKSRVREFINRG